MADLEDAVLECACAFLLSCYPVDERLGVDGFLRVRFTYCATHYAAYYRRKICPDSRDRKSTRLNSSHT